MSDRDPAIAQQAAPSSGGPALVGANEYEFRSGERIRNDVVASVCFAWVIGGRGVVRTGSTAFDLATFDLAKASALWIPWRSAVRWDADPRQPFRIGTVHLVPWHGHGTEVVPRVAFGDDPLLDADHRRGVPGEPIPMPAADPRVERIVALSAYAIDCFRGNRTSEACLRALGALMQDEYDRCTATPPVTGPVAPVAFRWMCDFVEENLDQRLSVADVARVGDCSPSTAERLFNRWADASISAWVRERRMDRAAALLTSSGMRVGEVARAVGFQDALYFSRVFSSVFGLPPSRYASGRIRP